jgi:hypothetical protein
MEAWLAQARQILGKWPQDAVPYFREVWGLDPTFAVKAATLYAILFLLGLNPRITSGFRDPRKQQAMRDAWDRGERQGLRVRPASPDGSRHCRETLGGSPASQAIDMPCENDALAARIAQAMGMRAGINFSVPDPGHYDAG